MTTVHCTGILDEIQQNTNNLTLTEVNMTFFFYKFHIIPVKSI